MDYKEQSYKKEKECSTFPHMASYINLSIQFMHVNSLVSLSQLVGEIGEEIRLWIQAGPQRLGEQHC
jgi:hypothetical protein